MHNTTQPIIEELNNILEHLYDIDTMLETKLQYEDQFGIIRGKFYHLQGQTTMARQIITMLEARIHILESELTEEQTHLELL